MVSTFAPLALVSIVETVRFQITPEASSSWLSPIVFHDCEVRCLSPWYCWRSEPFERASPNDDNPWVTARRLDAAIESAQATSPSGTRQITHLASVATVFSSRPNDSPHRAP